LITATAGRNIDSDGYTVTLGNGNPQAMAVNDTITLAGVSEGLNAVVISGVSANCHPFPASPVDAFVIAFATTDVTLGVECIAIPADIAVTFVRAQKAAPYDWSLAGIRTGTGAVEQLTFNPTAWDRAPDWSPDGTRLAWSRDGVIHIVNADGTGLRSFGHGDNPRWSPDGSLVAYDNGQSVLVLDPNGTPDNAVGVGTGIQPAWSPDGTRLAAEIEGATSFEGDIVVMNLDGSGVENITGAPVLLDREPTWSPDGKRIAFRRLNRNETSGYDIWAIDVDGSNEVRLLETNGPQLNPYWAPDNRILFDSNSEIWAIDLNAGGTLTKVSGEADYRHAMVTVRH